MNTLTIEEVKAIYDGEKARKGTPEGFDPRQSARVLVHVELLARNPMPCTSLTPEMQAARDRKEKVQHGVDANGAPIMSRALTHKEHEAQVAHQRAQVTEEQYGAFASARSARHPHTVDGAGNVTVKDAHHHVQKLHGIALWQETDRLVGEAVPS
jgi:hypothetical protein